MRFRDLSIKNTSVSEGVWGAIFLRQRNTAGCVSDGESKMHQNATDGWAQS